MQEMLRTSSNYIRICGCCLALEKRKGYCGQWTSFVMQDQENLSSNDDQLLKKSVTVIMQASTASSL